MPMDDPLYLTNFALKNFRSLGEVRFELPARPGVVVLEGPNGLGKTSWFEAVELALVGRVHRWETMKGDQKVDPLDHVRRRGASTQECAIELSFTSCGGVKKARWTPGADTEQATWLCLALEKWSLTHENLGGFLRGTHFLTQSPHLRLLHLPEEERWDKVLRNVSGYSEIDDLSRALQGSLGPLKQERNEREGAIKVAQEKVDDWNRRVAAISTKQDVARSAGDALSPIEATARLAPGDVPPGLWVDTEETARTLLAAVAKAVDDLRRQRSAATTAHATVAALSGLPAAWAEAQARVESSGATLELHRVTETGAQAALTDSSAAEGQARASLKDLDLQVAARETRAANARALAQAERTLPGAREELELAHTRRGTAEVERTDAAQRLAQAKARWSGRQTWEDQGTALATRDKGLFSAAEALSLLRGREAERTALVKRAENLEGELVPLKGLLTQREAERRQANDVVRSAGDAARVAREAAGDVQSLVAALAAHLHSNDRLCPLCLAEYGEDGELLKRATSAQARQSDALAHAEAELRKAKEVEETASQAVHSERSRVQESQGRLADARSEQEAIDREIGPLRARLPACVPGTEENVLRDLRAAFDNDKQAHEADPHATWEVGAILEERMHQLDREVRAHDSALAEANRAWTAAKEKVAQLEAEIALTRQTLQVDANVSSEGLAEQTAAVWAEGQASRARARAALASAEEGLAARRTAVTEAGSALARARADAAGALEALGSIERRWMRQNLTLPPASAQLSARLEQLASEGEALDRRLAALANASTGLDRWLTLRDLLQDIGRLDDEAGGSGGAVWKSHGASLEQEVERAKAAHGRAVKARDAVNAMSTVANEKRDNMRGELDARLQPVLGPILHSLIMNRDIADATLQFSEHYRKTRVGASLNDGTTPLLAMASEGQLAGVNLAIQLAMALAYPWSRWPAVLLDDPAQFSDVIHSANLVETLRMFARKRQFQVFVSTHDREFAGYIERKFLNDGLAATRLSFREPRDPQAGVVPKVFRNPSA